MELIIGGAYQGKTQYAKEKYNLTEADIHICGNVEIDFSKKCVADLEKFTFFFFFNKKEAVEFFEGDRGLGGGSLVICCFLINIPSALIILSSG